MGKNKAETVEVTKGFLEYRETELRKVRERLRAARAKLKATDDEVAALRHMLGYAEDENAHLRTALGIKEEKLRGKCADLNAVRKDPCGSLRTRIECGYATSRERALALTKLDECEMWLERCEPGAAGMEKEA